MVTDRRTTEWRDPKTLKPHPLNSATYGTDPDEEFSESVSRHGVLENLVIIHPDLVISGHRRRDAAIAAGLPEVPCTVLHVVSADIIPLLLVEHNRQRDKSETQILAEVAILKQFERKSAAERQRSGGGSGETPEGRTSEKVAEQIGVSENKARNALVVSDAIDAAEYAGDQEKADDLRKTAKESIAAAAKKVKDAKPKKPKVEIPKHLQRIWEGMPKWKEAHAHYGKLRGALLALSRLHDSGTREIAIDEMNRVLSELHEMIEAAEPKKLCPKCNGTAGGCGKCQWRGYSVKG